METARCRKSRDRREKKSSERRTTGWRYRRRRRRTGTTTAMTTRGVSRATHTRGGGVCGRYGRTKGLFASLGGLERLRYPTSLAILHRACASKAAHTATHPLIPSCSDAPSPRGGAPPPFRPDTPFRAGATLRFVESAFRGSLVSFGRERDAGFVLHPRATLPLAVSLLQPSTSSRPRASLTLFSPSLRASRFARVDSRISVLLPSIRSALLSSFLFISLRRHKLVSVISTMETKIEPRKSLTSRISAGGECWLVN